MTESAPPEVRPTPPGVPEGVGGGPADARVGLPSFQTLLRWLLLGRTVLAVTTLVQAALALQESAEFAFFAIITVVLALAVTAYGAYTVYVRRIRPGLGFLQSQAAMDLLLVTALVHFAGAHQSGWAALYVLVIAMYALLMPLRSGLVMALFGASLFLADATFAQPTRPPAAGLWGQVAVFTIVFVVVAFLGQRLRAAAAEQSQLESELEQVRLEADEILRHIRSGVMTVDGRGNLAFINPTAEQLLGLSADQLGEPIMADLARRAPELHEAVQVGIQRGRRLARAEGQVIRPDGRSFPIGLSTTTFEREAEPLPSVTAIFTDISDLQYLQELHLRAERLEAVAALSASLAHEIRNPLASIRSAVEQLARSASADDRRAPARGAGAPGERPPEPAPGGVPRFRPGSGQQVPRGEPPGDRRRRGPAGPRAPGLRSRRRGHRGRRAAPDPGRRGSAPSGRLEPDAQRGPGR